MLAAPMSRQAARAAAAFLFLAATPCAAQTRSFPIPDEFAYPQVRLNLFIGSGARALGMGGAFLARADDATAASWNPAGLSYLRRPEVSVAAVNSSQRLRSFEPEGGPPAPGRLPGERLVDDHLTQRGPDFLAAAYPVDLGRFSGAAQLSFQRVIPFAGNRDIERSGGLIHIDSEGGFDVVSGGIGLQVARKVRLGFTVNRWTNGYEVSFDREVRRPEHYETTFDLSGWNVNAGVIWTPLEQLNLGFVGKTPFTGSVALSRLRADFPPEGGVAVNFARRDDLELHFPGAVGLGVSWRIRSPFTVSADYTRTFWSDARIVNFFELAAGPLDPERPPKPHELLTYPSLGQVPCPPPDEDPACFEQGDTRQVRLGAEYVILRERLKWPLRVGYIRDRQYFEGVDGAPVFHSFTVGAGVIAGPVLFDVALLHERGRYQDKDPEFGVFNKTSSNRVFVSLIYRFAPLR